MNIKAPGLHQGLILWEILINVEVGKWLRRTILLIKKN